jgi:hypothetical protein
MSFVAFMFEIAAGANKMRQPTKVIVLQKTYNLKGQTLHRIGVSFKGIAIP